MGNEIDIFFSYLEKQIEKLNKNNYIDNEAMRHDLIIRPLLSSPITLGWEGTELISQNNIAISKEVETSYFWTGAAPKKKRPDMIIVPYGFNKTIAVVEEKKKKADLTSLRKHLGQLKEYQYLHNSVWGLLTDGNQWILQKNNEVFHTFGSIFDLKKHLTDLQQCIGRQAIVERLLRFGTADIVIARPSRRIVVIASPIQASHPSTIDDFIKNPSNEAMDIVCNLSITLRNSFWIYLENNTINKDVGWLLDHIYSERLIDIATVHNGFSGLCLSENPSPELVRNYDVSVEKWLNVFHILDDYYENAILNNHISLDNLVMLFIDTQTPAHCQGISLNYLKSIKNHTLFQNLAQRSKKVILKEIDRHENS